MKSILLKIWRFLNLPDALKYHAQRFFTQHFLVGVTGVIFNEKDEVLLFKHSYRKETPWGLPGGWLKKGEQPGQGLMREVREETGLRVISTGILRVESDPLFPLMDVILKGKLEGGTFQASQEVTEASFFPLADLPEILPAQARLIRRAADERSSGR